MKTFIGTAGWNIPSFLRKNFSGTDSILSQYTEEFNCVEINSSFYRDHKYETYEKWASMTPESFRFSVKLSRFFTQQKHLRESGSPLRDNLQGIKGLGEKWGVLLIQLPPSLEFDFRVTQKFIQNLRKYYKGYVVWEPRNQSWAGRRVLDLFADFKINKVLADPERCKIRKNLRPDVEHIRYLRLHGSPEIYKSKYSDAVIGRIAKSIIHPISPALETWCVFDNTMFGFAMENGLMLKSTFF